MKIQHLIQGKGVHTISPNDSISYTVDCLKAFHIGSLVVTRNRRDIEGIISERDIVQGLPGKFDMMEDLLVRDGLAGFTSIEESKQCWYSSHYDSDQ